MDRPNFVNRPPLRVEFSLNDFLSNTHYTDAMLQFNYAKYIELYWNRFNAIFFKFTPTVLHIAYWRTQIKFLGSDMIRRNFLTVEQLNEDLRFILKVSQAKVAVGRIG